MSTVIFYSGVQQRPGLAAALAFNELFARTSDLPIVSGNEPKAEDKYKS